MTKEIKDKRPGVNRLLREMDWIVKEQGRLNNVGFFKSLFMFSNPHKQFMKLQQRHVDLTTELKKIYPLGCSGLKIKDDKEALELTTKIIDEELKIIKGDDEDENK